MSSREAPSPPTPLPRGERGAIEPTSHGIPFSPRGRRCPEGADEGALGKPPTFLDVRPANLDMERAARALLTPGPSSAPITPLGRLVATPPPRSPSRGEGGDRAGKPRNTLLPLRD